jgi:homoserine kinase
VGLVAFVPNYKASTKKMREVLPKVLPYQEAVSASAIANTMLAHLLVGNLKEAGQLIESDLFHEPYREKIVPELKKIREMAHTCNAYATYLSGAGSTVMTLLPIKEKATFIEKLASMKDGRILSLEMVASGSHES